MARRVRREYVDEGDDQVVYQDRRPVFYNPVGAIVALVLLALLIWAVFWGPIGETFDGDGERTEIDVPSVNVEG